MKDFLKEGTVRANKYGYRMHASKMKSKQKKKTRKKKCDVVVSSNPGNILLSGSLGENIQVAHVLLPHMPSFEDHIDSNYESDDGSQCDVKASAFIP
eukprot:12897217-Ditylum_brightwellii.AAC.1